MVSIVSSFFVKAVTLIFVSCVLYSLMVAWLNALERRKERSKRRRAYGALRKFETADTRMPVRSEDEVICRRILLGVPERAIVVRVDREIAIIAPPILRYSYLISCAVKHDGFTLGKIV